LAFLEQAWDGRGARHAVADRKAERRQWTAENAPDVLIADAAGAKVLQQATETIQSAPGALRGVAASPGWASGPARLIHCPHEGEKLARGGILVASTTDPGWTPLFLLADGLVVETGGYLSHGAIVAREFGIPAIVNVPGLMAAVPDGSGLAVDGHAGVVTLIADTPSGVESAVDGRC
jgi:pyruvate,water dikinase